MRGTLLRQSDFEYKFTHKITKADPRDPFSGTDVKKEKIIKIESIVNQCIEF